MVRIVGRRAFSCCEPFVSLSSTLPFGSLRSSLLPLFVTFPSYRHRKGKTRKILVYGYTNPVIVRKLTPQTRDSSISAVKVYARFLSLIVCTMLFPPSSLSSAVTVETTTSASQRIRLCVHSSEFDVERFIATSSLEHNNGAVQSRFIRRRHPSPHPLPALRRHCRTSRAIAEPSATPCSYLWARHEPNTTATRTFRTRYS